MVNQMNDEIKEILDNVKKCCDITKDQSFTLYQRQDILVLLDYITNLQQDNTMYAQLKDEYEEEIKDLQQENQILKENAIHNDKAVDKARWNETIYKSRIDKAIEHIEKHQFVFQSQYGAESNFDNHLLDILKGDSDD